MIKGNNVNENNVKRNKIVKNSILSFEERERNRKCQLFGKMFIRSILMGYDSKNFVEQVMTYDGYIDLILLDDGYEWCDECYLLRLFENIKEFKKSENHIDSFELWFMGYLYKYWQLTRKMLPNEIYKIFSFEKFDEGFPFYHTEGWEHIINEVMR